MCDTAAFLVRNGAEEKILECVERVELDGEQVTLTNIFGEQQSLRARLRLFDNSEGRLVFESL
jgi:predicted RNA-binding protein